MKQINKSDWVDIINKFKSLNNKQFTNKNVLHRSTAFNPVGVIPSDWIWAVHATNVTDLRPYGYSDRDSVEHTIYYGRWLISRLFPNINFDTIISNINADTLINIEDSQFSAILSAINILKNNVYVNIQAGTRAAVRTPMISTATINQMTYTSPVAGRILASTYTNAVNSIDALLNAPMVCYSNCHSNCHSDCKDNDGCSDSK